MEDLTYRYTSYIAESSMEATINLQASGRFIPAAFTALAPIASYKIVEYLENGD